MRTVEKQPPPNFQAPKPAAAPLSSLLIEIYLCNLRVDPLHAQSSGRLGHFKQATQQVMRPKSLRSEARNAEPCL